MNKILTFLLFTLLLSFNNTITKAQGFFTNHLSSMYIDVNKSVEDSVTVSVYLRVPFRFNFITGITPNSRTVDVVVSDSSHNFNNPIMVGHVSAIRDSVFLDTISYIDNDNGEFFDTTWLIMENIRFRYTGKIHLSGHKWRFISTLNHNHNNISNLSSTTWRIAMAYTEVLLYLDSNQYRNTTFGDYKPPVFSTALSDDTTRHLINLDSNIFLNQKDGVYVYIDSVRRYVVATLPFIPLDGFVSNMMFIDGTYLVLPNTNGNHNNHPLNKLAYAITINDTVNNSITHSWNLITYVPKNSSVMSLNTKEIILNKNISQIEYFDLLGRKIDVIDDKGIYIKKTTYTDNTSKYEKIKLVK